MPSTTQTNEVNKAETNTAKEIKVQNKRSSSSGKRYAPKLFDNNEKKPVATTKWPSKEALKGPFLNKKMEDNFKKYAADVLERHEKAVEISALFDPNPFFISNSQILDIMKKIKDSGTLSLVVDELIDEIKLFKQYYQQQENKIQMTMFTQHESVLYLDTVHASLCSKSEYNKLQSEQTIQTPSYSSSTG